MPIHIKNKSGEKFCDFCGNFCGKVDEEYLEYSGYAEQKPKFSIHCDECWQYGFNCGFIPGCLVKNYGRVSLDLLKEKMMASDTNASQVKVKKELPEINWTNIDQLIESKQCKIKNLAESMGVSPIDLKELFESHYGDRVEYKRGRTGGVYWKTN